MHRGVGVVLLVVGVALVAYGFNEYGAFGSKLSRALSGRISDTVMFLWVGGGVCCAAGLTLIFRR